MDVPVIRCATNLDRPFLRRAVVELQEHERQMHQTRLPGEQIADTYLDWISQQAGESGAVLVAEIAGASVGFAWGWIEQSQNLAETADSNRFGYISDICVLSPYRGQGIAGMLLDALSERLSAGGVTRVRIGSLAINRLARAAYERAGFVPYEVIYEKLIRSTDGS
jgi:ribosomal protein S18 acetylase RimI-like enzyme